MSVPRADVRNRKDLELTVEEVETVIAALGEKVVRLQKDIATLKRHSLANGSHHLTDIPPPTTELTTRKVLRKRISRGIQYNTQDCQQANYRVTVKCFQRYKNSEINDAPIKHRKNRRSNNVSKAQIDNSRSIDNDKNVIWNKNEQTVNEVASSRREIDDEESQVDAGRLYTVDERNRRPPVVNKTLMITTTIPHTTTNSNEARTIGSNTTLGKRLDRTDRRKLDTGVLKTNHEKFVKDDSRVLDAKDKGVQEKRSFGEKLNKRKNNNYKTPKARSILKKGNKADDLVDDKAVESLKIIEKEKDNKLPSELMKLSKNKTNINVPDKIKSSSASSDGMNSNGKNDGENKKSVSPENNNSQGAQDIKNNSKSSESVEHPYITMKKTLNKCSKGVDKIVDKVTNFFEKKRSKNK